MLLRRFGTMTWTALRVVGTALQMFGLVLAAYGVTKTRRSYSPERLGIVGTAQVWLSTATRSVRLFLVTKVLRRRVRVSGQVNAATATVTFSAFGGLGQGSNGPLNRDRTTVDQLAALDERTRKLRDDLNRLEHNARDAKVAHEQLAGTVRDVEAQLRGDMQHELKQLATDGLSRQALGLMLTALGTILAALG